MKRTIKTVVSMLLCGVIFCVTAFAESFVYELDLVYANISFPMNYSVITLEDIDNCTDTIEKVGFTKEYYKTIMEDQMAYAVGYSEDLSTEIWLNVYTDENAESIFNMDNFTEEDREIFKESVTSDDTYTFEEAEYVEGKTGLFFKTVRALGEQHSVTYVTIKNGAYYSINLLQKNDGELTEQSLSDAQYVYESLVFTEELSDPNDKFSAENIITIICMAALCIVSFAIVVVVLKRTGALPSNKSKKFKTKSKRPMLK